MSEALSGGVLIEDVEVFERASAIEILRDAWSRVWSNGGCAGGDGVTVETFRRDAYRRIARLSGELRNGAYMPGPLRHVEIPKKNGGRRRLSIPSVRDRVAQTAVARELDPLLDAEFEESSFAYRKGRSTAQAVARIQALRHGGATHVVDADIENFFDRVPHDKLLDRLGQSMSDGPLTRLIALWLEHGGNMGRGIAQGSPLSPLLANLFLDRLDEAFAKRGARIVRFADDFVILCDSRSGAQGALRKSERLLAEQGLKLNTEKTRTVSFDQGFRFLGNLFVKSFVLPSPEPEMEETERLLRAVARTDEGAEKKRRAAEDDLERKRRGGLDPGQRVLYITAPGRRLTTRNQAFAVEEAVPFSGIQNGGEPAWNELLALHHRQVDRIEIGPGTEVTPEALRHAIGSDTALAFVNGHGETLGWTASALAPRAGRHLAQAAHVLDPDKRIALARHFVSGRLRNQRALLHRLNRNKRQAGAIKALAEFSRLVRRPPHEKELASLMGVEGRGAALYWPAFGALLDHGFKLEKRERRGAIGPVNIMLNMTASLLARDVAAALLRAGLHPGFGALHATDDRRDAAVYDLMEEFRAPLAESIVAVCVNNRAVRADMFTRRADGGWRMETDAVRALIREYERAAARAVKSGRDGRRRCWRNIITDQAFLLAAHVEGRETYAPHVLDY